MRTYLLGNGSNVLFADEGFAGAVICLTGLETNFSCTEQGDTAAVKVSAGGTLAALCHAVCARGLTGLEFAYGIPGTVGGAVYMNAGAYGGEIKDVLAEVAFLDENRRLCRLPAAELALGYRTSVFEKSPGALWKPPSRCAATRMAPRRSAPGWRTLWPAAVPNSRLTCPAPAPPSSGRPAALRAS